MSDKGSAFVKGGCGCLVAFAVLALLGVMVGGRAHINLGGAILLFLIGGVIGLVMLAVYNKGKREASGSGVALREQRTRQPDSERTDTPEVTSDWMDCPHCGARVNLATSEGLHSPQGEPSTLICDRCRAEVSLGR
jgi:hypothetical protein